MSPLITIILATILAAIFAVFLNFRFLLYPLIPRLNPTAHMEQIKLRGNTLIISDLHLKPTEPFKYANDLRHFIETKQVSSLIINGDLFNSPKDALKILGNPPTASRIFGELGLDGLSLNLFWILGSPPHDPPNLLNIDNNSGAVKVLGKCALIDFGRMRVMAYHGHDLSAKGAIGHGWNRFISKLSLERLWKRTARVDKTLWVFFGHTHIPGVDLGHRVANSGGWQRVPLVRPTKTGLLVSDGDSSPQLVSIA